MKTVLIKNSVFGVVQALFSALLVLITIPIFIGYIGQEGYGLFALYSVVGNLNLLLLSGFSAPLVKFISEQGVCVESSVDITIGSLALFLTSIFILVALLFFRELVVIEILKIPASQAQETIWFYWLVSANFFYYLARHSKR